MLPGKAPTKKYVKKTRYAVNAIDKLIKLLQEEGLTKNILEVCLIGGANVLQREREKISQQICDCIYSFLKKHKIKIIKSALGGTKRRSVSLRISTGEVQYTVGDSNPQLFYKYSTKKRS